MIDQHAAAQNPRRTLTATVTHVGDSSGTCSRGDCRHAGVLRVALGHLLWRSCPGHIGELIEMIDRHGFRIHYTEDARKTIADGSAQRPMVAPSCPN
jgi:hypothetical protein